MALLVGLQVSKPGGQFLLNDHSAHLKPTQYYLHFFFLFGLYSLDRFTCYLPNWWHLLPPQNPCWGPTPGLESLPSRLSIYPRLPCSSSPADPQTFPDCLMLWWLSPLWNYRLLRLHLSCGIAKNSHMCIYIFLRNLYTTYTYASIHTYSNEVLFFFLSP